MYWAAPGENDLWGRQLGADFASGVGLWGWLEML
jgi:hypothetical protein